MELQELAIVVYALGERFTYQILFVTRTLKL